MRTHWLMPLLSRLCPSAHQAAVCEAMNYKMPAAFDETRSFFIHIPKAAGTSVGLSLYGQNIEHQTAEDYRLISPSKFASYYKFAILREPIERFVSAFGFLKKGGMNPHDAAWAQAHLATYETPDQLAAAFISADVQREILAYYHFRPQADFVCDDRGRVIIDELYPMTDLRENFARICRRLGLERELPHLNRTEGRENRPVLSDSTIAMLSCVYRRDFELYSEALSSAEKARLS